MDRRETADGGVPEEGRGRRPRAAWLLADLVEASARDIGDARLAASVPTLSATSTASIRASPTSTTPRSGRSEAGPESPPRVPRDLRAKSVALHVGGRLGRSARDRPQARGRFIGARPDDVAITHNTTEGFNLLAAGLPLARATRWCSAHSTTWARASASHTTAARAATRCGRSPSLKSERRSSPRTRSSICTSAPCRRERSSWCSPRSTTPWASAIPYRGSLPPCEPRRAVDRRRRCAGRLHDPGRRRSSGRCVLHESTQVAAGAERARGGLDPPESCTTAFARCG